MSLQCVEKREQRIDRVQRRPSAAPFKAQCWISGTQQVVEYTEVGLGGFTFQPAHHIGRRDLLELTQDAPQAFACMDQAIARFLGDGFAMITQAAANDGTLVVYLADYQV